MKKLMKFGIWLLLILSLGMGACSEKGEEITPSLKCEDLYVVEDEPSDTVRHRIYEIYQKYGVPVYFNDTIAKIFDRTDIHGDSVFRYETMDLNWGFTSYGGWKYSFDYMKVEEDQLLGLQIVEEFLKLTGKVLYPHAILIADRGRREKDKSVEICSRGEMWSGFRILFLSGEWAPEDVPHIPSFILRGLLEAKIQNYPDDLEPFGKVTDKNCYGGIVWELANPKANDVVFPNPYDELMPGVMPNPLSFSAAVLEDTWIGMQWWNGSNSFGIVLPQEELVRLRKEVRAVIGGIGFINGNRKMGGAFTPANSSDDLKDYLQEMLNHPKEEFEAIWGEYPLVMKKYTILYNVIKDRLGVEL